MVSVRRAVVAAFGSFLFLCRSTVDSKVGVAKTSTRSEGQYHILRIFNEYLVYSMIEK